MCAAAATTRSTPARTRPTKPFSALPHPLPCGKKAHSPFVFPRLSAVEKSAPASHACLSAKSALHQDFPSAMRAARREEPHRSPNLCDNQRQDERFSPFSMRAKPSPRRRRNALPGGAFAFSVLQFFTKSQCEQHAEKNRAALRIFAITSAQTSASARSQCAKTSAPPQEKRSSGRGVCIA